MNYLQKLFKYNEKLIQIGGGYKIGDWIRDKMLNEPIPFGKIIEIKNEKPNRIFVIELNRKTREINERSIKPLLSIDDFDKYFDFNQTVNEWLRTSKSRSPYPIPILKPSITADDYIDLLTYCSTGNLEGVTDLIRNGILVNPSIAYINTINKYLPAACNAGHLEIVIELIRAGIKVNNESILNAFNRNHENILRVLLTNGGNLDIPDINNVSLLMKASQIGNLEIVRILVEFGANVDDMSSVGDTALMYASARGNINIVRFLLTKNVNTNSVNYENKTALIYARENNHIDIVSLLEEYQRLLHQLSEIKRLRIINNNSDELNSHLFSKIGSYLVDRNPSNKGESLNQLYARIISRLTFITQIN
jgi:serine/threonine-protein phosphatase 6 regulatory ankyrin repeat subunit B